MIITANSYNPVKNKNQNNPSHDGWVVYILECCDGSLYTGVTNNIEKRVNTHNSGKGAKYTRARRPVALRYYETAENKSNALKREIAIKKLTRQQKMLLISSKIMS